MRRPPLCNTLICGDTLYHLDPAYRAGASAARNHVPYACNPHRTGSTANDQWAAGHVNETVGEHVRRGIDVVSALPDLRREFEIDPTAPQDGDLGVDLDWYEAALPAAIAAALKLRPARKAA